MVGCQRARHSSSRVKLPSPEPSLLLERGLPRSDWGEESEAGSRKFVVRKTMDMVPIPIPDPEECLIREGGCVLSILPAHNTATALLDHA